MRRGSALALAGLASAAAIAVLTTGFETAGPARAQAQERAPREPFTMAARRLTESQYRHIVADAFGPGLEMTGRFEPERREEGLQAIGNAQLTITSSGFEQYFAMANQIAAQVVSEAKRGQLINCQPADAAKPDDACARQVLQHYGLRLFRRPMTKSELENRLAMARSGAERTGSFYEGLRLPIASLLVDPEFLFRIEAAEPEPRRRGQLRLDAYSKASRLSFLLWDTGPDEALLQAAADGSIHTDAGLKAQVDRMLASPRLRDGAQAFFIDMLQFEHFDSLTKDGATYPKFSQKVADSAREQTLRTMLDLVVEQNRDYRDIFTSNETFIDRALAAVYQVPYPSKQPWTRYTFPESSERSGILTQVTFLSLFSHPAASSPTKRGVKINEIFMCQIMPDPPPDVDFSKVQALDQGTVRTRLLAHMENEGCASCHRVTDPVGLSLEHFDGLGQLRTLENGQPIDVSAQMDSGVRFHGAQGLGRFLHDEPSVPSCLVRNVFSYGVGRPASPDEEAFIEEQAAAFAASGYRYRSLLASLATNPRFYHAGVPDGLGGRTTIAAATPSQDNGGRP